LTWEKKQVSTLSFSCLNFLFHICRQLATIENKISLLARHLVGHNRCWQKFLIQATQICNCVALSCGQRPWPIVR
jgi:hypothetical protein